MIALDWIGKWADYTPEKVALTSYDTNEKYTYKDVAIYADQLKHEFLKLGLKEGDRIAVLAEHGPAYIIMFCACQRMGVTLVPLNYRLSVFELNMLIKDCSPELLVYSSSQEQKLRQLSFSCIKTVPISNIKSCYKEKKHISPEPYTIKEEHPIFIFYTSGTTGKPKGVIYTNKMMFWNSLNTSMQLGITYQDSTINTLPPYHTSGWHIFITPLLHKGAHIGMLKKFDAEKTLCLLELNQITLFMALPTMLMMMQKTTVFKNVHLKKLRYIISGGELVNADLVFHWKKEKNIHIRPGYGLTEAGPGITSLHHKMILLKPNSVGKPNFYLETKIIDEHGQQVKTGTTGELCIKGNIVTPGYWNNSVATADKIKGGWLHTGDLACNDSEGYLYLKGRKDDMYISGGENVYPQEVETVIEQLEGIKKAVVLSAKDEKWGACGVAFIALEDKTLPVAAIRNHLKEHLVCFKHPKYIFLLDEIPLTSLGKVSRKKLYAYFNSIRSEQ